MVHFERLTALDNSFLDLEGPDTPMHLAATLLFDRRPLLDPDGLLDMPLVRRVVESRLHQAPRLRMKLLRARITGHPAWVDDPHFELDYHLRYLALPPPGTRDSLRALVGQVLSQPLDRSKPLWEIWVVDGIEGDRVAAICKMHHCLMDGMAGVGTLSVLLHPVASSDEPEATAWDPRPAPTPDQLLFADALRRASGATRLVGAAAATLRRPLPALLGLRREAEAVALAVRETLTAASDTPLNRQIGPHRVVRWVRVEVEGVKEVKRQLGGTVNDVVVATVAGAMRRFLARRGSRVDRLRCRALFPVNVRSTSDRSEAGNRLAAIAGPLPVHVRSARRRYEVVRENTARIKESPLARGTEILNALAEWLHAGITSQAQRFAAGSRTFNVVITNVPGPAIPLFMLQAPMLEVYPTLPLFHGQALSVAVFSYAGFLHFGLTADRTLVPDLEDFAELVKDEVLELRKAATA